MHPYINFQVNNRDVDLDRVGLDAEPVCYSGVNPFYVRLLSREKSQGKMQFQLPKKRVKSPVKKVRGKSTREESPTINSSSSKPNCKFSMKLGKMGSARCTPESKRRRRSRLLESVDLHSSGWHEPQWVLLTVDFYRQKSTASVECLKNRVIEWHL